MPTWPSSLPQDVLVQGYEEGPPNTLVRTEMDQGPDKVRRRSTAGTRTFAAQAIMTKAQVATLDSFILDDLSGGALRFDWVHPRTQASVSFRFVPIDEQRIVTYSALGGDVYRVQMQLEILPS
jgi:hypothetical protein